MDTYELQAELAAARAEIEQLRQANDELCDRVRRQTEIISRAKDIAPFARPSFGRVLSLAKAACLDLCKGSKDKGGGWILSLGSTVRRFKSLIQIWDILTLDSWSLSDLFGYFLIAKPCAKKIIPVSSKIENGLRIDIYGDFGHGFSTNVYGDLVAGNVLTQAQNSFEIWNCATDDCYDFFCSP
ncbi:MULTISPECIES: hypothetical protein [unclassified Microcoleus]|uniref:hypothetical protein n=1 Tax=unclassified Microcoleus TaxID=2642155 RepID=UPI002FCF80DC